jgi:hypothetical protein
LEHSCKSQISKGRVAMLFFFFCLVWALIVVVSLVNFSNFFWQQSCAPSLQNHILSFQLRFWIWGIHQGIAEPSCVRRVYYLLFAFGIGALGSPKNEANLCTERTIQVSLSTKKRKKENWPSHVFCCCFDKIDITLPCSLEFWRSTTKTLSSNRQCSCGVYCAHFFFFSLFLQKTELLHSFTFLLCCIPVFQLKILSFSQIVLEFSLCALLHTQILSPFFLWN